MRTHCHLALALASLASCNQIEDTTLSPDMVTKRIMLLDKLDVLLVIDNSTSTIDKQTLFAANFVKLANALDAFPTGRPDLHVGIVSTTVDLGVDMSLMGVGCPSPNLVADGRLQISPNAPACGAPTDRFLADTKNDDGTRTTNYTGTLADAVACTAQLGDDGCGFESPLEAMKRALDGSHAENAGFLRDDADLAVIILTDEDDCSVADSSLFSLPEQTVGPGDFRCQPLASYDCDPEIQASEPGTYTNCTVKRTGYLHDPQEYVQFLATIKDPSQTFVGLIAGDPTTTISTGVLTTPVGEQPLALEPSCSATIEGNFAIGRPGIRLADFEQSFAPNATFETVCQADYSGALSAFGQSTFTMMSPCLEGAVATADVDPNNPGLQLDCNVSDRDAAGNPVGAPIPRCLMADAAMPDPDQPLPCYAIEADPVSCPAPTSGLAFEIVRSQPVDAVLTQASCAATP